MKNNNSTILKICFCALLCSHGANGQSLDTKIGSYGLALPKENVMLRATIDSHVQSILAEEGQFVRKGDVLIELKKDAALAKLQIAKLAVAEAGAKMSALAELEYAKSNYAKSKSLFQKKAINEKEFEEARLRLQSAKANLEIINETLASNQAKLELAHTELEDHFIRAPFDGQIAELRVSTGSAVSSNTDLVQVISSDKLRVNLYLPVGEAANFKHGDSFRLKVEEPFEDTYLDARLVFQSPMIDATTGAQRVTFEIDNRQRGLPAGISVTLVEAPSEPIGDWLIFHVNQAIQMFRLTF